MRVVSPYLWVKGRVSPHFLPALIAKQCSWLWLQGLRRRTPQAYPRSASWRIEEAEGA